MKSARELFEELGYDLVETAPYMMYYYNEENEVHIWFYNNRKTIEIVNEFTLDILQAINQQVNELGWYRENDYNNLKIHYEIKPSFTKRKLKELQQERDLYKEVIEEVREYIEKYRYITDKVTDEDSLYYGQYITMYAFNDDNVMELLQILDKVIGDNK